MVAIFLFILIVTLCFSCKLCLVKLFVKEEKAFVNKTVKDIIVSPI